MTRESIADVRKDSAEIVNRAAYCRERTIITRHEKDVAAVISIDELRLLEALIERYEDEQDVAEARQALLEAREDSVAWEAVKRDLGL